MGFFKSLLTRRTVKSEAERGATNALKFLATNPNLEDFNRYLDSAYTCQHFDDDPVDRAYDAAVINVLRMHPLYHEDEW